MSDAIEHAYTEGKRQALVGLLREVIRQLGADPDTSAAALEVERQETIAALRELCEDYGDNDWPDNLALADVIRGHLERGNGRFALDPRKTWTREAPSEPGWYWMADDLAPPPQPQLVKVEQRNDGSLEVWCVGDEMAEDADIFPRLWMGPISEPPPPGR